MPIQFDSYQPSKIERLHQHLESLASKGKPAFYEILVDGLRAVPRTDNVEEFDGYEEYLTPESNHLKVIIYGSERSKRNDSYVFVMKAANREEAALMGLSDRANTYTHKSIADLQKHNSFSDRQAWEMEQLQKEHEALKVQLQESEDFAADLEKQLAEAQGNRNKLGNVQWSDVVSAAMEGMLRRNAHLLAQIPGASGLAGIIEQDNQRLLEAPQVQVNNEVTYKKKSDTPATPVLNDAERSFLELFGQLQHLFTDTEMEQVIMILDAFSRDKSQLLTVAELLEIQHGGDDQTTQTF